MDSLGRKYEFINDVNLCFSVLLVAFSLIFFSMILLVMSFGWYTVSPDEIAVGLSYKFNRLLGWPKYLIAYVTFIWTLLYLSKVEYALKREGSRFKNICYFASLYLYIVGMLHLMINFVYYSMLSVY